VDGFFELMAHFVAVGKTRRGPYITGYKKLVIPCYDATRSASVAGGSLSNGITDFHEVFIPSGPDIIGQKVPPIFPKKKLRGIITRETNMNNEFIRQYKRISKSCQGDFTGKEGDLKEVLIRLLGDFPKEMAREVVDYFLKGESFEEEVQKGADLLELHNGDLNGSETVFSREDWEYIKELVNAYSDELDMEWMTFAMQFLLDNRIL
jgi:hypothetical protein